MIFIKIGGGKDIRHDAIFRNLKTLPSGLIFAGLGSFVGHG